MSSIASIASAAADLRASFGGQLLKPADEGYEEARKVHSGLVDKRPALIARCRSVADVRACNQARPSGRSSRRRPQYSRARNHRRRDHDRPLAHEGRPGRCRQQGRMGTGRGDLERGQSRNAASPPCSHRRRGLDHRDRGPDPRRRTGLADRQIRPGTSLEYELHAVGPIVIGGPIVYPIERSRDVLEFFRASTRSLTDEHVLFASLTHAPAGSGTEIAVVVTSHCGSVADVEPAVRPLKQFGTPILDAVGPIPYCELNRILDANYPKGAFKHWKSNFLAELSDGAIATMIECFAHCPTPMGQFLVEHIHGAATRIDRGIRHFRIGRRATIS